MSKVSTYSYISNPMSEPFMFETIPDRMHHLAAEDPDRAAFVFYDLGKNRQTLTRKQFLDRSVLLAKRFVELGLTKGSHVAVCMSNSIELLLSSSAVICSGAVPFYMSSNMKSGDDIIEQMRDAKCAMLLIDANEGDNTWKIIEKIIPLSNNDSSLVPGLKKILCNGTPFRETSARLSLRKMIQELEQKDCLSSTKLPECYPEDTVAYFSTSGSTGKPNALEFTHFSLLNWTRQSDKAFEIRPTSVYFCERPMTWHVGFPRSYFVEGCTVVFTDTNMSASGEHVNFLCDVIERESCDVMYVPGYFAADLLSGPPLADKFKHVDTIIMAGERMRAATTNLVGKFCRRLYNWYGLGEGGGISTYCIEEGSSFEDGIVGKPVEGYEVMIVDENGSPVSVNTPGEILMRSQMRFIGYFNMMDTFRESVDDRNWLHSGDIGRMRPGGNIVIEGRKKEQISIRTIKIFPWDIEKVLINCPGVEKAFAVGVPDIRSREVICACVVSKPDIRLTQEDIRAYCSNQFTENTSTGSSLMPTHFLMLDIVPLTNTGKVDRRTLGLIARQKLGL